MRMPTNLFARFRNPLTALVWTISAVAAFCLYRQGVGGGDAVGIAEAKEHRVAPVELGRLVSLNVKEGDRVAAGQIVAQLETTPIQEELSVAEARLRQMASEVGATGASLDVDALRAERQIESEISSAEVELRAAESGFKSDEAELRQVTGEIQRQKDLVNRGLTKIDRLKELEMRRASLEELVSAWPARMSSIQGRMKSSNSRLEEWRTHSSSAAKERKLQLQPIHNGVQEQKDRIQLLRSRLVNTALRASSESFVAVIQARPGDVLKPGDPVMTLVEVRPRMVVAYVEERRGTMVATGTKVMARRRNGSSEQFAGTVATVSGQVSQMPPRVWLNPNLPTYGRAVFIQLPPDAIIDPGEAIDVRFIERPSEQGQLTADARTNKLR